MGTPEFAKSALQAMVNNGFKPVVVYTQPPRPAGRGQQLQKSPVHIYAETQHIPVLHPQNFKSPESQAEFKNHGLDLAVVAAYGLLLPQTILDAPKLGCINIHASLLPRWRGAAPIQRAILAGDTETGICLMQMDAGLDTGAVFSRDTLRISSMNAGELHDAMADLGAKMIVRDLPGILNRSIPALPQSEIGVTYAKKIAKDEARIDWNNSAAHIERQVRAFNPFPGAYFEYNGERIKILSASIHSLRGDTPGTVIGDDLNIATADGILCPLILQRAGKSAMEKTEFLRGIKIPANTKLT